MREQEQKKTIFALRGGRIKIGVQQYGERWPTNSEKESTGSECSPKPSGRRTEMVNGSSPPSPKHVRHGNSGSVGDILDTYESWNHKDTKDTNVNHSLRPIGAEHRATSSGATSEACTADPFVSTYKVLDDIKQITPDITAGLGLSNLHLQDGSLSTEDDLGFDPWNESRKALADLIEEETVSHTEPRNAPQQYTNNGSGSPRAFPTTHPNCIPTPEEMEFLRNWKAGLQALLPNINISFSDTFSSPLWNPGDTNGSNSLSNSPHNFKSYSPPTTQTPPERSVRPPPGFERQNSFGFPTDINPGTGLPVSHGSGTDGQVVQNFIEDKSRVIQDFNDEAVIGVYGTTNTSKTSVDSEGSTVPFNQSFQFEHLPRINGKTDPLRNTSRPLCFKFQSNITSKPNPQNQSWKGFSDRKKCTKQYSSGKTCPQYRGNLD